MWNQWCHTWGDDQAALEKGKKPEDDEASIDEEFDITSLNQAIQLSKQQATLNSMGLDVGQCSSSGVQDESEMDKDKWALTTVGVQWGPEAPLNVSPIQSQPLRRYSLRKGLPTDAFCCGSPSKASHGRFIPSLIYFCSFFYFV